MKLNGALKPHRAFPDIGGSSGAKYRHYQNNINNNNINNFKNNNDAEINSNNSKSNKKKLIYKYNINVRNCLKMMRIQQSNLFHLMLLLYLIYLMPINVLCNDDNGFFGSGPETTTPEFDYASRGSKKFGDRCESTLECGFPGSICDPKKKSCQCTEDLPVTNHIDKCGRVASINESCFFNEQCEASHFQTECRDLRCVCRFDMTPTINKDGNMECKGKQEKREPERYVDPAMIGVLVGMALMFIIICVVLRLFSRARWRENRTIFNTPNPRLMNVSLLRDNKLLHGQERRGSRMSVRGPSRQPSMASLRPHSPNPSLGKTGSRPGSRGSSASQNSNTGNENDTKTNSTHPSHQPLIMPHITTNPVAENVTIEITDPKT